MAEDKDNVLDIREQVEARRREEAEKRKGNGGGDEISSKFIQDCLYSNELGDGLLFCAIHGDRFVYNRNSSEWYSWAGHFWELDLGSGSALASVENVCDQYLKEAMRLAEKINQASKTNNDTEKGRLEKIQDNLYGRVSKLRSDFRRKHCLTFAHSNNKQPLAVFSEQFDTDPWKLACLNGVIDLRTGNLKPGLQEDYITKAAPVEWRGIDAVGPVWENMLLQSFDKDDTLVEYVNRLLGYGITGLSREHILPILWGQGRNGKGTIVETVSRVLGPLAGPVQSELLLDQGRVKGSTGPSPDIMALKGLRVAFASETDEGRKISPSRVKWLSGGDTLVGRNLYDRYEVKFSPTHTLFLLTNHKPYAPADDFAFWERVHLIPFNLSFVNRKPVAENERPADLELDEKLKAEASGILAWLVRGCLQWQERGLDPPPTVTNATEEYRRDEDILADFIDECCFLDARAKVKASIIYSAFNDWFKENMSKKGMSQKRFGRMMTRRFKREKSSVYYYYGVGLKEDQAKLGYGDPDDRDH